MVPCVTLWIGPQLGVIERACLRSVLRHGHRLVLYCYTPPEGVPEGVELADAATILPESSIVRYKNGSVALFANRFRYELQRRAAGIWLDTDVYLIAPLPDHAYLFGYESKSLINTAILRCAPDWPVLIDLIALFEQPIIPPWLTLRQRLATAARRLRDGHIDLGAMPWGATGPRAFTALAMRHRMTDLALPRTHLYPVRYQQADWIRDPSQSLETRVTPETLCVHLWNEVIRTWKEIPAEPGSFLHRLQHEGR